MIYTYGKRYLDLQDKSLNKLLDLLNSTKELIIFNKENIFINQYIKTEFKSLGIQKNVNLVQKFPKFFLRVW